MIWPFKRKEDPPVQDRRSANDWKCGDLAVCVASRWHPDVQSQVSMIPVAGEVYRVCEVYEAINQQHILAYWLCIEGFGKIGFESSAFRKAVQDRDACEEEFRIAIRDLTKGLVA